MDNISVFNDTQEKIKNDSGLKELTENAIAATHVIDEGFFAQSVSYHNETKVSFEENLTLISAYALADAGKKTAVLNFANPVEPGGGVLRGANAQEEYLCRASNLYNCLISPQARDYYDYHNKILKMNQFNSMFLASDKLIYSCGVTFFKEDRGYIRDCECKPTQDYSDKWRTLDVITCAAPFFSGKQFMLPDGDLYHLMCRRIRNIFEAAIAHNVEAPVLGAFGCGAFHNPPAVVAKAFQAVLLEERYSHAFSDVIFAIKRSGGFCENIEAFEIAFQEFPPTGKYYFSAESNKRRFFQ